MSQHPFNIADQSFPSMLTTLNQVVQALASNSSGTSEPSTTYPYQFWPDTTNNLLKMRNGANNAWMTVASFDVANSRWQPRFDVMQLLSSAGLTVKKSDGSAAILTLADDGTLDVPVIKQNGSALGAAALKGFTDNDNLSVDPGNVGTRGNMAAAIAAVSRLKSFTNFDGSGTPVVLSSMNISSITKGGTGDYALNFTVDMPHANYAVAAHFNDSERRGHQIRIVSRSTTQLRFTTARDLGSSYNVYDSNDISVEIYA